MQTRSVRAFLFDLDGVLVDTTSIVRRGWEKFAAARGRTIPEGDYAAALYGRRSRDILSEYFELPAAEVDTLIASGLDDKTGMVGEAGGLNEIPGAAAFVQASKALGLEIGVASSASRANVALALKLIGVDRFVDAVITAADVVAGKPAPDPYLAAARALGVPPGESAVFEDTVFGIESARAAGAVCIAVATTLPREGLASADMTIDDFRGLDPAELLRALDA